MSVEILNYMAGRSLDQIVRMSDEDMANSSRPMQRFVRAQRILETFKDGRINMLTETQRSYQTGCEYAERATGKTYRNLRSLMTPTVETLVKGGMAAVMPGVPRSQTVEKLITKVAMLCADWAADAYITKGSGALDWDAIKSRLENAMFAGAPDIIDAMVKDLAPKNGGESIQFVGDMAKILIGLIDEFRSKSTSADALTLPGPDATATPAPKVDIFTEHRQKTDDAFFKKFRDHLVGKLKGTDLLKKIEAATGIGGDKIITAVTEEAYKILKKKPDAQPSYFQAVKVAIQKHFKKDSTQAGIADALTMSMPWEVSGASSFSLNDIKDSVLKFLQGEGLKQLSSMMTGAIAGPLIVIAEVGTEWLFGGGKRRKKRIEKLESQRKQKPSVYKRDLQRAILLSNKVPDLPQEPCIGDVDKMLPYFSQCSNVVSVAFDEYREEIERSFVNSLRAGAPTDVFKRVRDQFIYDYDAGTGGSYRDALTVEDRLGDKRTLASYYGMREGLGRVKAPPPKQFELMFLMQYIEARTEADEAVQQFLLDRVKSLAADVKASAYVG